MKYLDTINLPDHPDCSVWIGSYAHGQAPCVRVTDSSKESLLTLSVNLPGVDLAPGEIAIKTWSENEPYIKAMLDCGLFEDTGHRVPTGFARAHIWRLSEVALERLTTIVPIH